MTGRSQTLPWWLGGRREVKTTEKNTMAPLVLLNKKYYYVSFEIDVD
jgi:hypothetical protein